LIIKLKLRFYTLFEITQKKGSLIGSLPLFKIKLNATVQQWLELHQDH
jgi:hypothetical protein